MLRRVHFLRAHVPWVLPSVCTILLLGCKEREAPAAPRPVESKSPVASAAPNRLPAYSASPTGAAEPLMTLELGSVGNQMKYDKEELTVKTGARVRLVLHNNSSLAVMPHNWTLVRPGTEAAVAKAGLERGEAGDYISPGPDVLAHTPLARAKQTVEVTFTAPTPGTYPYICTTPGHYVVMHGKLIVTG